MKKKKCMHSHLCVCFVQHVTVDVLFIFIIFDGDVVFSYHMTDIETLSLQKNKLISALTYLYDLVVQIIACTETIKQK